MVGEDEVGDMKSVDPVREALMASKLDIEARDAEAAASMASIELDPVIVPVEVEVADVVIIVEDMVEFVLLDGDIEARVGGAVEGGFEIVDDPVDAGDEANCEEEPDGLADASGEDGRGVGGDAMTCCELEPGTCIDMAAGLNA